MRFIKAGFFTVKMTVDILLFSIPFKIHNKANCVWGYVMCAVVLELATRGMRTCRESDLGLGSLDLLLERSLILPRKVVFL